MNKFYKARDQAPTRQTDTYDAEIIEDIPEQFDPNRYKKLQQQKVAYQQNATPEYAFLNSNSVNYASHPPQYHKSMNANYRDTQMIGYPSANQRPPQNQSPNQNVNPSYGYQQMPNKNPQLMQQGSAPAQFAGVYPQRQQHLNQYQYSNNYAQVPQTQSHPGSGMHRQPNYINRDGFTAAPYTKSNAVVPPNQHPAFGKSDVHLNGATHQQQQAPFSTFDQKPGYEKQHQQQHQQQQQQQQQLQQHQRLQEHHHTVAPRAQSETRKKYTFEDDDDPYNEREYFLRGGDDVPENKKWAIRNDLGRLDNTTKLRREMSKSESELLESTPSDSSLNNLGVKPSQKKHGVTFDEKLEVHEVQNPHYGLEIKTEKREMKKKKKDKRKEEDAIHQIRVDMKARVQSQNMILYNFYEKTLIYNAMVFYEENFYRNSILRLQEKMRNTNKTDEKLKEQLMQIIQKDNQITLDVIKYVKKDYMNKLEPFCSQFQTSFDKLHTFPGMYQVIQNAANSVNYNEIINHYAGKEGNHSPSGFKKILGHEARFEKFLGSFQAPIKSAGQHKADLWLSKNVLAAIDMHVKEMSFSNYKTLTEIVFKLNEVCENDLHRARAIYKYILTTQLEPLRRNETGALLMLSYDAAIESTNTIFARLCSIAGIEAHCIRGLWKTVCMVPGEKVESKCLWNIVSLDGSWRFVQPSFTPMKYYSRQQQQEVRYEETEYYFLSDSETLFTEFMPQEKFIQFSEAPPSVKEFEKRPILTPHFRHLNLSIVPLTTNLTSNFDREPFRLTLRYPREYENLINFKYILQPINMNLNYSISSLSAERDLTHSEHLNLYVISELIYSENAILFKISALPQVGSYNFTVYAGLSDEFLSTEPLPSTNSLLKSLNTDLKAVASFRINCAKLNYFETPPNRIDEITMFGMNNIMRQLGMSCHDFKQGILGTDREGKVNLVFEMSQPLDIEAYLYSSDLSINSKYLELCILKRVVHNFLILIIQPPHPGIYGLDLHGAPKGTFSPILHSQLPPIGKYLVKCHHQLRSFTQFPRGDNREWGPKQRFYDMGLHAVSYTDPYILNDDGKQIEIEVGTLKSVTMWFKLYHDYNGTPREINNFCFMNYKNSSKREKSVSFLLRFPYRGFYHLALMATDIYPSKPDEIVYNYLIRVQDPGINIESFPVVMNPILWKNCCLVAPKNYRVNSYDVHFSVKVPNTNEVVITASERIVEKLEAREIENSWVGLVSLNEAVNARFVYIEAEFDNKYKKLLKFKGLRDSNGGTGENYFN